LAREWSAIFGAMVNEDNVELRRKVMNVAWVARMFSDNQHMLRMKFGMKTTINKKTHTTRYQFPSLTGAGNFVDQIAAARAADSLVEEADV
jgi:hypothetical protein